MQTSQPSVPCSGGNHYCCSYSAKDDVCSAHFDGSAAVGACNAGSCSWHHCNTAGGQQPTSSTEHCSLWHATKLSETAFAPTIPPAVGPKFGPRSIQTKSPQRPFLQCVTSDGSSKRQLSLQPNSPNSVTPDFKNITSFITIWRREVVSQQKARI